MVDVNDYQVILLCGGKGERLRPLTTSMPKPLIPIKEKAILSYIIDHLLKFNLNKMVAAVGYKSDVMTDYLKQEYSTLNIPTVDSGDSDIIKRILDCREHIQGDFMVLYGDTLSDVQIDTLLEFHRMHGALGSVTLWPLRSQFGVMEVDKSGKVFKYAEKPLLDKWINIGYFCFKREAFDLMQEFDTFQGFIEFMVENDHLYGYQHKGIHITVNTQKELSEAEKNINLLVD